MKYISILLILLLSNCKINQQAKENKSTKNQVWSVVSEKKYKDENIVDIKIINKTKSNLVIFDPFLKNIEKYDGKKWIKIKTSYCPCGNCPPPPETMTIASHKKHTFNWDKNIVTCENGKKISQKMESGIYRVIFNYAESKIVKSFEKLVVEFEI